MLCRVSLVVASQSSRLIVGSFFRRGRSPGANPHGRGPLCDGICVSTPVGAVNSTPGKASREYPVQSARHDFCLTLLPFIQKPSSIPSCLARAEINARNVPEDCPGVEAAPRYERRSSVLANHVIARVSTTRLL